METLPSALPDAEAVRERYLKQEASIQSIGTLYLLGCGLLVVLGVAAFFGRPPFGSGTSGLLFLFFAAAEGGIGWYLRKLDSRAKVPATILAIFGLFAFPVGTLISAYILYLLHSAKGKYVFSPEYRDVIAATPHIRYRLSIVTWVLIVIIIGLLVLGLVVTLFGKP